jgi:glycine cleavage system T protein
MKTSPLHERHTALAAVFEDHAGSTIPVHYGDPLAEHGAVRRKVGIADLSHRGKLRVTGEDRIKWLQSVISNDILPLKPGQRRYSSLLTHKGKMLTYFRVYLQPDHVFVEDVGDIGETTFQALRKFLLYGTKAKLDNCRESWGLLLVSGPSAAAVIQQAFGRDPSTLGVLDFVTVDVAGRSSMIIRTEETGEEDFEIFLPADAAPAAWDQIMQAGQVNGIKPFGRQTREALRMEAGLPQAGPDLNEEIVPPEANLEEKAFSLSKGCYPGQEVVARMDTYGSVRRRLVGLLIQDTAIPARGAKLFSGDREVGWISSAVRSPQLQSVIAFGFPLRDFSKSGTALAVDIDGSRSQAVVKALPFYTRT